jgi:phosphate transport system protein
MSLAPHTLRSFDQLVDVARQQLAQMGARVERQLADALECLSSGSRTLIDQVMRHEAVINDLERSVDALASQIMARQKPAANDLRLLITLLKATTDLERIGDESKKIALAARNVSSGRWPMRPPYVDIDRMARSAQQLLRRAVQILNQLDPHDAAAVSRDDAEVNDALRNVLRQLISYMIEDPRTISSSLDVLFIAKSLERIGDHAKNLAEHVVYAVSGEDVRHADPAEIARASGPA